MFKTTHTRRFSCVVVSASRLLASCSSHPGQSRCHEADGVILISTKFGFKPSLPYPHVFVSCCRRQHSRSRKFQWLSATAAEDTHSTRSCSGPGALSLVLPPFDSSLPPESMSLRQVPGTKMQVPGDSALNIDDDGGVMCLIVVLFPCFTSFSCSTFPGTYYLS